MMCPEAKPWYAMSTRTWCPLARKDQRESTTTNNRQQNVSHIYIYKGNDILSLRFQRRSLGMPCRQGRGVP